MQIEPIQSPTHDRYARAVSAYKRARWDIDQDVIRGRRLATSQKFLPDALSQVQGLEFLGDPARRFAPGRFVGGI